jgi:hypothetical protein
MDDVMRLKDAARQAGLSYSGRSATCSRTHETT